MSSSIRRRRIAWALACAGFLSVAAPALAVDGMREINQTCAVNTGCFSGDGVGFPVEITERGSYVLTSDLEVPDANTTAIEVTAPPGTTIDLNGFAILGPGGAGTGDGIVNAGALTTVRNGTIRQVGGRGIDLGSRSLVQGVTVSSVGSDGVRLADSSLLLDSIVHGCGDAALEVASGQVGYARNMFQFNTGPSIEEPTGTLAVETGGNYCEDLLCSSDGKRRFYLTTDTHAGDEALDACDNGFHMASLWEIFEVSRLRYDATRGHTAPYSGEGPPSDLGGQGWIRTGGGSASNGVAGSANCFAWTGSDPGQTGSVAYLSNVWTVTAEASHPWGSWALPCSTSLKVWCVQD